MHSDEAAFQIERADEDSASAAALQPGDRITLTRGLLQLTFPKQVEAIIEGPARINLRSTSELDLDGGHAWFRVPKQGRGFTVRTDHAKIIDLGTEFGIASNPDEQSEIHVQRGQVRVEPFADDASPITLDANHAVVIDADGRPQKIDPQPSLFRQTFSPSIPYLHWSFNHLYQNGFPASGSCPNLDQYAFHLRHLDGSIDESDASSHHFDGAHNMALRLHGDGTFAESSFTGIRGRAPRTVAAWIRCRPDSLRSFRQPTRHWDLDAPYPGYSVTTPFGHQAYLLNYGNTGLTTRNSGLDESITADATYHLSFHLAARPGIDHAPYRVELVAFEPGHEDSERRDHSRNRPGDVLAYATGKATAHDMSEHDEIRFTVPSNHPALGKKLAIRLVHTGKLVQSHGRTRHSGRVFYDHIVLEKTRDDHTTTLFTEGFESPTVNGFDPKTPPGPRWIEASKNQGLFNEQPPFTTPFLVWGQPQPGQLWASFIYHTSSPNWSTATGPAWLTSGDRSNGPNAKAAIPLDRWTHVATVFTGRSRDNGQPEIIHYLDGQALETRSALPMYHRFAEIDTAGNHPLRIGALPDAQADTPTLNADIDELFLFRTALSRREIQLLMEKNSATALKN